MRFVLESKIPKCPHCNTEYPDDGKADGIDALLDQLGDVSIGCDECDGSFSLKRSSDGWYRSTTPDPTLPA